uniref:Kinesin-like protein n=1 Tax=Neobodo designis TaxID=312471 RepID=A0A7S1QQ81_NEODS|mmetsp:Transcript_50210/g.155125  ORF Transcript_50210/g.155125 Transcript_50210/m.155125 type:complete len:723 (+) Transcript_50210:28-2196(+)
MDLSSWAERNKAHRDAERLEVQSTRRKPNGLAGKAPGLELEPLAKPLNRGRDTGRQDQRAFSMSPSARQADITTKRAQYEQANQEYLALMKREQQKKSAKWDDTTSAAKRSARLPSLPVLKSATTEEERPSARTPPPGAAPVSSTRTTSPARDPLAKSSHLPVGSHFGDANDADNELGYLSGDDEAKEAKKRNANRIRVIVRKRPLNEREGGEDVVECQGKGIHLCATKLRVDLTEYQESHQYEFDDACTDKDSNRDVYEKCGRELITTVFEGGSASCFAYGQTGSGKTHTMIGNETEPGIYVLAAEDIFARAQPQHRIFVSLYEIYCNSLFDLLNQRQSLQPREDANRRINICGLTWHEIRNVKDLLRVIDRGAMQRRTGSTSANEFSSRSHAVMTISLRDEEQPKFVGSLNVVDLAGSERAADTAANDKQTRLEGAEINKSLLALKECIRGLDEGKRHIQFRGSKLTEVLRDSFVGNSRTVMIATVGPSSLNAEHSLNTLRYAFRVKGLSFDCPKPSKERNAPRPTQRSKSTDAEAATRKAEKDAAQAQVAKKKRSHKKRTPRRATSEAAPEEIEKIVQERLKAAVGEVKEQLLEQERKHLEEQRRQADEQKKQAEMIAQLHDQLKMLNAQLRHERPARLPPLDGDAAAAADPHQRPRSDKGSRRSRRRHSHQAQQSPNKSDTIHHSGSFSNGARSESEKQLRDPPPPVEEVVTLDELTL